MREILFRGKRIDGGGWFEGYLLRTKFYLDDSKHSLIFTDVVEFPRSEFSGANEIKPETVGQYTGLTDKNGVRIFEGDVLSTENGTFSNTGMGQIMFRNGMWLSYYGQDALDRDCFDELHTVCNSREVIGNIHDNTELLEDGI